MPKESRLDVAKPGPLAMSASRLRTNNAASTTNVNVKAICAVTIIFRSRALPNAVPLRSPSDAASERLPGLPGGSEAAAETRDHTGRKGKEEKGRVDSGVQCVGRGVVREEGDQSAHGDRSRGGPEQSARERDQQAVSQKLTSQASARSAQGKPHAHLAIAGRAARQEQAGDVQTGQAQQDRGHSEQHP